MSTNDGDGRHLERIICIYMRWWECHFVLKLCRLHEMGCRMGTDNLDIDESELGPLTPSEIGENDGIFRCFRYPPHFWYSKK